MIYMTTERDAYSPRLLKTKRVRRTKDQLDSVLARSLEIIEGEDDKLSIRHLFYRLESEGVIEKTEKDYDNLRAHLTRWRRAGLLPWGVFTDNTRWHIGRETFGGMQEALERTVSTYRRDLWEQQDFYVEVWTEKDAIAGIVSNVADSFGVKTFVCRGNASLTSLYNAADTYRGMQERGKRVAIVHFGDHDPSGLCIDASAVRALRDDFGVEVEFTRAAVTVEQITSLCLRTRPPKAKDSRAGGWVGGCVEVDAIPSATLKELVEHHIVRHIEPVAWARLRQIEDMERQTMRQTLLNN